MTTLANTRIVVAIIAVAAAAAVACGNRVDIEKVPVGADVQVTRQDGGVVEGKLAARDEKTVTVKSTQRTRTVPRDAVADVQVVTADKPAALPAIAKFREYVVPDGTTLKLNLQTEASSETSRVDETVEATLIDAVRVDGVEVVPAGSVVRGRVTDATSAGKVKGRASLALHFETVESRGDRYPISAGVAFQAKSTKGKDAAKIGIPAVAGAIIGGIVGGGKGAAAGAAIGGGGGAAVVLLTEGKPVVLARGANLTVTLAKDVEVRVPVK